MKSHRTAFYFDRMTKVIFYKYNGHPNTVNKQLGTGTEMQGSLRQEFSILRPALTLRTDTAPQYNYAYIGSLGRYYFVDNISYTGNKTYELTLRVDVLKTYESEILAATGRVTESDNPNPYISNRETVYEQTPNFEKVSFPNTGLLSEEGTIIMVTIKGNKNGSDIR